MGFAKSVLSPFKFIELLLGARVDLISDNILFSLMISPH